MLNIASINREEDREPMVCISSTMMVIEYSIVNQHDSTNVANFNSSIYTLSSILEIVSLASVLTTHAKPLTLFAMAMLQT